MLLPPHTLKGSYECTANPKLASPAGTTKSFACSLAGLPAATLPPLAVYQSGLEKRMPAI